MLSERLAAKDQKKTAKETKGRGSNASVNFPQPSLPSFKGVIFNYLQINSVKNEQKPVTDESLNLTPVFRAPVPRMHLWPTVGTSNSTPNREWEEDTVYSTPTMRRRVPNFAAADAFLVSDVRGLT